MRTDEILAGAKQRIGQAYVGAGQLDLPASLPPGVPHCPDDCPGKRALAFLDPQMEVWNKHVVTSPAAAAVLSKAWGTRADMCEDGRVEVQLPKQLQRFIRYYDGGSYVDLVDQEALVDWLASGPDFSEMPERLSLLKELAGVA